MAINEAALKRAQEKAFEAFDCQLVRDGHPDKAAYERYDRALIQAYLSDEEVKDALGKIGVRMGLASVEEALRAIGGR